MKCHYDVLNIERNADESAIKAAYRKLALKWHPDKNLDNPEGAREEFQLVQQAYEVLSDHQERIWYNNHREQILRGSHTDFEDNSLDVFQYFTASCYKGFGDAPGQFYYVYSEVFEKLASEEIEYMKTPEEYESIPKFGKANSPYAEIVGPFYAYWQSFCTRKSYAWLSSYNICETRNRRELKFVEKENKKVQQKARKLRNDAIRNLVAFVRKRDKRFQEYKTMLEEKAAQNRLKVEENRIQSMQKRREELAQQKPSSLITEANEEGLKQLENAYLKQFGSSESEYTDDDADDEGDVYSSDSDEMISATNDLELKDDNAEIFYDKLFCIACNKSFKTNSAFSNHESSKKHRDNLQKLKKEMIDEDNSFEAEKHNDSSNNVINEDAKEISDDNEELVSADELAPVSNAKNKKNKKKSKTIEIEEDKHDDLTSHNLASISDDENSWKENKKGKKNKGAKPKQKPVKKILLDTAETNPDTTTNEEICNEPIRKGKKTKKNSKVIPTINTCDLNSVDVDHTCVTCHQSFDSKNKLFQHLKKMGHGVFIPKADNLITDKKGAAKKKEKN